MRRQLFLFIFIVLLINSGCKKNPVAKLLLKEELQKTLDKHLANYKEKFHGRAIGFGLYIKSTDKSHYQNLYVSSGIPQEYGDDIHFRGGSTTKTFTAAAILRLRQQNKINLDDFITDNIPGTNEPYIPATEVYAVPYKDKITIRLLLQHRAGVFDVSNTDIPDTVNAPYAGQRYFDYVKATAPDHTFTFPELINVVAKNHLSYFEPGTAFHYSNTGYNILATIIERVSGKRYDQFLQDEFLTPLQLNHTLFPYLGTDQTMPAPYMTGWEKVDNELKEIDKDNISLAVSEGNIITTPADLATWTNALYGTNTILNAELHAEMIAVIPTNESLIVNYGLGVSSNPPDLGYGHNGATPAYMTTMRYHPETKTSYVLFCNFLDVDDFAATDDDMYEIIREAIQAVQRSE